MASLQDVHDASIMFFMGLLWDLYKFSLVFYWISMVLLWDLEKVPMGFP